MLKSSTLFSGIDCRYRQTMRVVRIGGCRADSAGSLVSARIASGRPTTLPEGEAEHTGCKSLMFIAGASPIAKDRRRIPEAQCKHDLKMGRSDTSNRSGTLGQPRLRRHFQCPDRATSRTRGSDGSFGSAVRLIQRILVDVVAIHHAFRINTHLGFSANVGKRAGSEPVGSAQTS